MEKLEIILILARKLLFGLTVGLGFFMVVLFSKPLIEKVFLKKAINDDFYYWTEIAIAIILGILAMIII
ncbi:MAG: hypothetical protein WC427_01290 [Candidatus Paceibacterota bacterium]|jgi:hypothetical protein